MVFLPVVSWVGTVNHHDLDIGGLGSVKLCRITDSDIGILRSIILEQFVQVFALVFERSRSLKFILVSIEIIIDSVSLGKDICISNVHQGPARGRSLWVVGQVLLALRVDKLILTSLYIFRSRPSLRQIGAFLRKVSQSQRFCGQL